MFLMNRASFCVLPLMEPTVRFINFVVYANKIIKCTKAIMLLVGGLFIIHSKLAAELKNRVYVILQFE